MFGQPNKGFAGFGASNSTFGGFGQSSTGFGSGSAFGTQTPASGSSLFGGASASSGTTGGLFGQGASTFGQTQNSGFSFGGTQTSNAAGSSLFGASSQPAASGGSLFATPSSGSGFGAKPGGFSGFGQSAQPAGSGLFGSSAGTTPSLFGQTGATSAFGTGAGATAAGGTTVAFNPPSGTDTMMKDRIATNINTRHQCITAMKEYEAKSLEELRMEDYASNRKSKQAGGGTTGGLFGQASSTQTSTGGSGFVFGGGALQTSTTGFGGFGATSSATTPFNQNRPLFGTATTTQSGFGFGSATGTQQSNSLFGNTARPLFGSTASTQPTLTGGSSFFGGSAAGAANPVGFGSGATGGGLFGGTKPTGFGAATTSSIGFGGGSSLFGKTSTASTFGGFGTNTSTAGGFGTGAAGGSLFNMKPGGFGTGTTGLGTGGSSFGFGTGLGQAGATNTFGNTAAKTGFGGFSFGGATGGTTTGFGSTLGGGTGTGTFNLGAGTNTLGQANAISQANSTQHLLALASSPYGDNPLFWNLKQQSKDRRDDTLKPTNPTAQKAALASANQYKVSPRPTAKIKPKSLHNLVSGGKTQLFEGLEDEDFSFGEETFVPRKSVKKLVLRKGPGNKSLADSTSVYSDAGADSGPHASLDQSSNNQSAQEVLSITRPLNSSHHDSTIENEADALVQSHSTPYLRSFDGNQNKSLDDSFAAMNQRTGLDNQETPHNRLTAADTTTFDLDNSVLPVDRSTPHPTGVTLTRPGYYTIPALDDMIELMDENGNCYVEDLTIGRKNYGSVFFPGITNVAGMNLDDIVHFRRKEITIYPDDEKKPPLGDGLNKKAEVTLDCVWPTDKSNRTPIKSPDRLKLMNYTEKIEAMTARIGAKFMDYRPETGSWVFQVNHFSKYGLLDDSDEEGSVPMEPLQFSEQQAKDILLVQKLKTQQEQLLAYQKQVAQSGQGQIFTEGCGQGDMQTPLKQVEQAMMQEDDDFAVDDEENDDNDLAQAQVKKYLAAGLDDDEEMNVSLDSKLLASTMGVSAQNIQGMKASFFGDNLEAISRKKEKQMLQEEMDDYEDDMRNLWKKSGERTKPSLMGLFKYPTSLSLPQSPAFSDHSEKEGYESSVFGKSGLSSGKTPSMRPTPQTFMQPPIMEHKLLPSGLQPSDMPQRIKGTRIQRGPVHFRESLLHNNQRSAVDAACFMGRSFRVGWGPTWTLAHSGNLMGLQEEEPQSRSLLPYVSGRVKSPGRMKGWFTHIEQIQVTDYMDTKNLHICKQQEELLEVQLKHARVTVEENCPRFIPAPGVDALHQLADRVRAQLPHMESHPDRLVQSHMDSVFELCVALWGNLPQADDLEKDDGYRERQLRREAVSKWLAETSACKVAEEMEACPLNSPEAHLRAVFSKLTVREVSSACKLAQRAGDYRLALLLAQIIGGPITRQMLAMQLESWAEQGAIEFITELRQKVYCLLAGQLVWQSQETQINTCEGLDWKRAFAMHLWYKSAANASVQHSLKQYQHGFQGTKHSKAYCAAPLPPYLEEEKEEAAENEHIYDTTYHLLCLYADRTHGLEALLSPISSSPAHLDFRLSWQLSQVLLALDYRHLPASKADSLHESFASQLETLGMWHWAAFVLLHLSSGSQRQAALSALLQRHLGTVEDLTEQEVFLIERLHVPAAWLHQAKAVRAHSEGNHDAEARHLILAGQFNKSHMVLVRHVAADAIINDNDDYLKSFLDELALPDRCVSILNWNSNGKVFLDFINLRKRLQELKQSEPTVRDMEELEPSVKSLCGRVKGLTCMNSKDRLCQAEMAKTSASLLRTFLALRAESPFKPLTTLIPDLPMSEDYTLQELQALSRARLMEIV
ncbi:hypothetical protein EGW08_004945 [Elysia chlorotica]|uniref:Nuclear pore complex protein Nup98-Nup96 n=1 Tax=Elysia chlorotica TaxID=188477 RepID=A0A433U0F9_ELYCH|nr:hypothetical protein EGW08_004945 [Elysia chlorotica]